MKKKYLNYGLIALLLALSALMGGCDDSDEADTGDTAPVATYQLYIDVTSEDNLLFHTYAMDLYLDEKKIGTVEDGGALTRLISKVTEGRHELSAYKTSDRDVYATQWIDVDQDMTFRSQISHGSDIEFEDSETIAGVEDAALKVPEVTGLVLSDALEQLDSAGFVNVSAEPDEDIWDEDNWTVVSQNIGAGVTTDKNAEITLTCVKTDTLTASSDEEDDDSDSTSDPDSAAESSGQESQKDTGTEDQTDGQKEDSQPEAPTPEEPSEAPSATTTQENITAANNPDFAALIDDGRYSEEDCIRFGEKYRGRNIEFDCCVADMQNHESYTTRYDFLLYAGDYSTETVPGPPFRITNKNASYDLHWGDDTESIGRGTNLHLIATIDGYDADRCYFEITPVQTTSR